MAKIQLNWGDDLKAESDFIAMGVPFSKITIHFDEIDLASSKHNGARFQAVRRDLIDDYKIGLLNGDRFPRPAVHEIPGRLYYVDSGVQRTCSVDELIKEGHVDKNPPIDVYLIDTEESMILEAIARSGNVSHGGRSTIQERAAHAVYMHMHHGMSAQTASKLFMVSESTIQTNTQAESNRKMLSENGIRADHVPIRSLAALDKIDFDEGLKLKVGTLVAQHSPSGERVKLATDKLRKCKSDFARRATLKEWEKELSQESQRATPKNHPVLRKAIDRPRRDRLFRDLQKLTEWLEAGNEGEAFANIGQLQIVSNDDFVALRGLWERLRFRLDGIVRGAKPIK